MLKMFSSHWLKAHVQATRYNFTALVRLMSENYLIEAHAVLQQRCVKVIASCVKTSNGGVSRQINAVMVMLAVETDLMRRIAVSVNCTIYRTQRFVQRTRNK